MRRLFNRKSADTVESKGKLGKEELKEVKPKKSFFGRSSDKTDKKISKSSTPGTAQSSNNVSSASSTFSMVPPAAAYVPTPTGSSSSVSSVISYTDGLAGTPGSVSTAPSTVPSPAPSTFSRSPGSHTSLSSAHSTAQAEKPGPLVRPSISPISRPGSRPTSSAEPRKVPSPLSAVMDSTSMLTPPSSRGGDMNPKRRNSIYNIFRKSLSQPDLHSAPSSRSNSTTTLPTTCTAPFMPPTELVPQATPPLNKRASVILRRATGMTQSLEDVISSSDGVLSRNEATAHRAILMGDPLGGGGNAYFRYPIAQGTQKTPKPPRKPTSPPPGQGGHRNSRRGHGRPNDQTRRNSWAPGPGQPGGGGMVWREPQFGGRYGGKMTIDEENEMMEQYAASRAGSRTASRAGSQVGSPREYLEDVPYFQQPTRPQSRQRPVSMSPGTPNGGYMPPMQHMQRNQFHQQQTQQLDEQKSSPAIEEMKIKEISLPSPALPTTPIASVEPLAVPSAQPQPVQV